LPAIAAAGGVNSARVRTSAMNLRSRAAFWPKSKRP
jgi:hypothetical protein